LLGFGPPLIRCQRLLICELSSRMIDVYCTALIVFVSKTTHVAKLDRISSELRLLASHAVEWAGAGVMLENADDDN